MVRPQLLFSLLLLLSYGSHVSADDLADNLSETLDVGPGRQFDRIEAAYARASAGDVIAVYPQAGNEPYARAALKVTLPGLHIVGMRDAIGARVALSGKDYDYSGVAAVPRAVFQFDRSAQGCVLEGFEIFGAHNDSHNGAGIRINQANDIVIRDCDIHHNDMGIMSNGDGTLTSAAGQLIENCVIHHNGDPTRPGYNHNLYLGGASVVLRFCEVHSSLTGQNVKSRAHHNWFEYCYVHDSANREFDLVDDDVTALPGSHTVLLGNLIVKALDMTGNHEVIHFGQDIGGEHRGDLVLIHNTFVNPYESVETIAWCSPWQASSTPVPQRWTCGCL